MDRMTLDDYSKFKRKIGKTLKGYRAIVLYGQAACGKDTIINEFISDGWPLKRCRISGNLNDAMQTMLKTSIEYDCQIIFTITSKQDDLYREINKTDTIPCFEMKRIPFMYHHNKHEMDLT